jgi:predicted metal-dependent enzyme (double-stranded beta helix superfamily)
MAIIIHNDGSMTSLNPANGTRFTLEELQAVVGGYIEFCDVEEELYQKAFEGSGERLLMVIDEEGKLKSKPVNWAATALYKYSMVGDALVDVLVGDVLLASVSEIDGVVDEQ